MVDRKNLSRTTSCMKLVFIIIFGIIIISNNYKLIRDYVANQILMCVAWF